MQNVNKNVNVKEIEQKEEQKSDEKEEFEEDVITPSNLEEKKEESEPIDWVELVYSSVVETFSSLDLYTDFIIMLQLYASNNMWWSSWMLMLLLMPYLVSYGALSTLLQERQINYKKYKCLSFLMLLLMTPFALIYLFGIDVIFMTYSLLSTTLFVISFTKIDIRDKMDEYVFNKWLNMTKTEIIGYRRLRTLSQLFFETIPQILLQLRMLYVIEWSDNKDETNQFQIDVSTIFWSVALAFAHLILEGGIVYFDSKALKLSFLQYGMVCLGGRINFIPYQHLINNIIQHQIYMQSPFDEYSIEMDHEINVKSYAINKHTEFMLDFDTISADFNTCMFILNNNKSIKIFRYIVSYQFSNESATKLYQKLSNCPAMQIPSEFNLSSTNIALENLMKNILCKAQMNIGSASCGSIDIYTLCILYKAGIGKIKLNINGIDAKTGQKLISNTNGHIKNINKIQKKIENNLINFGETSAIKWIYKHKELSFDKMMQIKRKILRKNIPNRSDQYAKINLNSLRNCLHNHFYVAFDNKSTKQLHDLMDNYASKCDEDESLAFVSMFLVFYSTGMVYSDRVLIPLPLKNIIAKYIPIQIQIGGWLMSYEYFEASKLFENEIESILIETCKNWIISDNFSIASNPNNISIYNHGFVNGNDVIKIECESEMQFVGKKKYINVMHQLFNENVNINIELEAKSDIEMKNIALMDEIAYELKLNSKYNHYFTNTLYYRKISIHKIEFETVKETEDSDQYQFNIPSKRLFGTGLKDRYQIYELIVIVNDNKCKYNIYFDTFDINYSFNDRICIYNSKDMDDINIKELEQQIIIDQTNIGLRAYNYYQLHDTYCPQLVFESDINTTLSLQIKHIILYKLGDTVYIPKVEKIEEKQEIKENEDKNSDIIEEIKIDEEDKKSIIEIHIDNNISNNQEMKDDIKVDMEEKKQEIPKTKLKKKKKKRKRKRKTKDQERIQREKERKKVAFAMVKKRLENTNAKKTKQAKLDRYIGEYYRKCKRDHYFNVGGQGLFLRYVEKNGIDVDAISDELENDSNWSDCSFIDFDDDFPLENKIYRGDQRQRAVFKILQRCWQRTNADDDDALNNFDDIALVRKMIGFNE